MDTGTTLRAGSNILGFANYFTSGTAEDNAVVEGTGVSNSRCNSPVIIIAIAKHNGLFDSKKSLCLLVVVIDFVLCSILIKVKIETPIDDQNRVFQPLTWESVKEAKNEFKVLKY